MGRFSWPARLAVGCAFLALVLAGAAPVSAVARAAAVSPSRAAATAYSIPGTLNGVAAISANDAWAVGVAGNLATGPPLIVHWNGRDWSQVRLSLPSGTFGELDAVTAVSADNIWAVGDYTDNSLPNTIILVMHWNGKTWSLPKDVPQVQGTLYAVGAWGSSVWAVGTNLEPNASPSLAIHLVSGSWYVVPVPNAPTQKADGSGLLTSLAVTGANSAWAGGYNSSSALLFRWTGAEWKSASVSLLNALGGVWGMATGPGSHIWLVGVDTSALWTGKSWQSIPVPGDSTSLDAVTFAPGGSAWAVGQEITESNTSAPALIVRWTGKEWENVKSPIAPGVDNLLAVSANSVNDAWVVGSIAANVTALTATTLIEHWNGKAWS